MSVLLDALKKAQKENQTSTSSLDVSDEALDFSELKGDATEQATFFKVTQDVTLPDNAEHSRKQFWILAGFGLFILAVVGLFFRGTMNDGLPNSKLLKDASNQTILAREHTPNEQSNVGMAQSPNANLVLNAVAQPKSTEQPSESASVMLQLNTALMGIEDNVEEPSIKEKTRRVELITQETTESKTHDVVFSEHPAQIIKPLSKTSSKTQTNKTATKKTKSHIAQAKKKILTVQRTKTLSTLTNEGYVAYQTGNYGVSLSKYVQAYRQAPENKDALLGMAAVHTKLNQPKLAAVYYQKLKALGFDVKQEAQRNTRDDEMRSPNHRVDLNDALAQLKSTPNDARLNFSVANLFAKKRDWAQAQTYYFKAHQYNPSNPNYVFNLAVSLEHIGQPKAALTFYQKTRALMANTPSTINPMTVAKRLDELSVKVDSGMVN